MRAQRWVCPPHDPLAPFQLTQFNPVSRLLLCVSRYWHFCLAFCFFNAYPNHIGQPLAVSCKFRFTPLHKYHVCVSQHPLARPGRSEFGRSVGQAKSAEVRAEKKQCYMASATPTQLRKSCSFVLPFTNNFHMYSLENWTKIRQ